MQFRFGTIVKHLVNPLLSLLLTISNHRNQINGQIKLKNVSIMQWIDVNYR